MSLKITRFDGQRLSLRSDGGEPLGVVDFNIKWQRCETGLYIPVCETRWNVSRSIRIIRHEIDGNKK